MARSGGSSGRWLRRQSKDPYVERASREGWRSRAVFKLEQIDRRERLIRTGEVCVDLGAAPGGWSQYLARKVGPAGRVVAVDLLPMDPIVDVTFVQADFSAPSGLAAVREALAGATPGVVLSDMAPNISGNSAIDQPRSMGLAELALDFAVEVLGDGGVFLVKLFQGEGFDEFVAAARARFRATKLIKPRASRQGSREIYLLARQYRIV